MYYPWVIGGMEVWGGKIYPGNPILEGTPFAASNYYANNFNNFLYAYVTCFELMVVNNWTQIASGYVAISGPSAWLFFITFNLWVVIIIVRSFLYLSFPPLPFISFILLLFIITYFYNYFIFIIYLYYYFYFYIFIIFNYYNQII